MTRVRLIGTSDQFTKLKQGDEGTLISEQVDPWGDTVSEIQWDSGSRLSLISGLDHYEVIG